MDWFTCSKTFIKVVDETSFAQAARKLYTTQSAVSKRIAWLESMLDTQLLARTTRRLDLTEAGEKYYNHVLPLIDEWEDIRRDVATTSKLAMGELRVAIPLIAGNHYISQLIPKFLKQYPEVKLVFHLRSRLHRLLENQIDVYISNDDFGAKGANASQKITGPCRRLYASPSYLAEFGEPKSLKALEQHNCLVHTAQKDKHWHFQKKSIPVDGNFRSNSADSLIKAALSGVGIVFVPETFVHEEVEKQQLQVILPQYFSDNLIFYASYPDHKFIPMKTKVFIQFLKEELP